MEKKTIINPFAQKGRIITGDAFIGRFENLRTVASNVTEQAMPNNLAIIGYPRIGKSSLAKQAIIEQKVALIKEKKISIWIDFSKFSSRNAFFKNVVRYSYDELKKNGILLDAKNYVADVLQQENWDDLTYYIEKYFEYTISEGYYFIFILDEFDEARSIFKGNSEAFKMLRELAYDSNKFGVAWVTTSRRSIKEIEVKSDCSSSNFNLIMTKEYLSCYNNEELLAYFQLYENIGISLSETKKSRILYYCGGHPYLLAFLGFEIVEAYKNNQSIENIDNIFSKIWLSFLEYYEQLIDLLREDKTFEKMLQILFGPVINVTDDDIKELRDVYGLLQDNPLTEPDGDRGLIAFSQHFQEYLKNLGRKVDFWSLWTGLEVALRELITKIFKQKHQENWLTVLKSRHADFFTKAEDTHNKAKEDHKNDNLLYYLDAQPIFEIIKGNKTWADFKDIFGGDRAKVDFEKKMQLIIKIRNPYAHSRFSSITPTDVQQAELYCQEILDKIKNWL